MKSTLILAAALLPLPALGQTPAPAAPHDPAIVFPIPDVHTQLNQLIASAKEKGSSGATIEDYGSYKIQLSARAASGEAFIIGRTFFLVLKSSVSFGDDDHEVFDRRVQ